jgi:hypothetical protein
MAHLFMYVWFQLWTYREPHPGTPCSIHRIVVQYPPGVRPGCQRCRRRYRTGRAVAAHLCGRVPLINDSMVWSIRVHLQQVPGRTGHLIPDIGGRVIRPDASVRRYLGYGAKFTHDGGAEAHTVAPCTIPGGIICQYPPSE